MFSTLYTRNVQNRRFFLTNMDKTKFYSQNELNQIKIVKHEVLTIIMQIIQMNNWVPV